MNGHGVARPWLAGSKTAAPFVPGIVAVGILYGATAAAAGMVPWTVVATSALVATGTAQFVALEMMAQGMAWWVVVMAGLAINLRYAVYALHLGGVAHAWSPWRRLFFYGMMTDEGYALAVARRSGEGGQWPDLRWTMAATCTIWLSWVVGTAIGAHTSAVLPSGLGFELVVPLTLLQVLLLLVPTRRHLAVAVVAGTTASGFGFLPHGSGFLAGLGTGVLAGLLMDHLSGAADTGPLVEGARS